MKRDGVSAWRSWRCMKRGDLKLVPLHNSESDVREIKTQSQGQAAQICGQTKKNRVCIILWPRSERGMHTQTRRLTTELRTSSSSFPSRAEVENQILRGLLFSLIGADSANNNSCEKAFQELQCSTTLSNKRVCIMFAERRVSDMCRRFAESSCSRNGVPKEAFWLSQDSGG